MYMAQHLQIYNERQHLKHPIPFPFELSPVGKTLNTLEWNKFCKKLPEKLKESCTRQKDGTLHFLNEDGLAATEVLLRCFKNRFHFRLKCDTEKNLAEALKLAQEKGIPIHESSHRKTRASNA